MTHKPTPEDDPSPYDAGDTPWSRRKERRKRNPDAEAALADAGGTDYMAADPYDLCR